MNWVPEKLGARAIIYAGPGAKDGVRAAIQFLSPMPKQRTVYLHTGWRKIEEKWLYLHADGAIGAEGMTRDVEVELPSQFAHYSLPEPPQRDAIAEPIRQALDLLEVAPSEISFALFAIVFLVLLFDVDFVVQLVGPTGVLKTALLAMFQSFFGAGW